MKNALSTVITRSSDSSIVKKLFPILILKISAPINVAPMILCARAGKWKNKEDNLMSEDTEYKLNSLEKKLVKDLLGQARFRIGDNNYNEMYDEGIVDDFLYKSFSDKEQNLSINVEEVMKAVSLVARKNYMTSIETTYNHLICGLNEMALTIRDTWEEEREERIEALNVARKEAAANKKHAALQKKFMDSLSSEQKKMHKELHK